MRSALRLTMYAQACLFLGLTICVVLIPHFLFEANEGGVSNYGIYAKTVAPYTLAFGVCSVLTIRSAFMLRGKLRPLLITLGILYLLVLLSTYPYKVSTLYGNLHHIAGALLVFYTVALGTWFSVFKARSLSTLGLFAAQLIGFLLAVLTYLNIVHVLFIAEFLESLAFGVLLIAAMAKITEVKHQPNR